VLEYQERPVDVKGQTREQMMIDALEEWGDGKVGPFRQRNPIAIRISPEADGIGF